VGSVNYNGSGGGSGSSWVSAGVTLNTRATNAATGSVTIDIS
jgi:hypothetical protein